MKDKVTTKIANEKLASLIEFARSRRGFSKEIQKHLNRRTKKKWNRENIDRWLHKDPAKRTQPLLGVGLLLAEIGKEIMADGPNRNDHP